MHRRQSVILFLFGAMFFACAGYVRFKPLIDTALAGGSQPGPSVWLAREGVGRWYAVYQYEKGAIPHPGRHWYHRREELGLLYDARESDGVWLGPHHDGARQKITSVNLGKVSFSLPFGFDKLFLLLGLLISSIPFLLSWARCRDIKKLPNKA